MPQNRLPSAVLELRGSFKTHPERRRIDAEGAGAFDVAPPGYLEKHEVEAWHELVAVLPAVALTGSDAFGVCQAARLLAEARRTPASSPAFRKLDESLRRWLAELGCTPNGRSRLGVSTATTTKPQNPFEQFGAPRRP